MGVLDDFGFGRLRGWLSAEVKFLVCRVDYIGRPPVPTPPGHASLDDAIHEWAFGTLPGSAQVTFPGSVTDLFLRTLNLRLLPVGGPRIWRITLSPADYLVDPSKPADGFVDSDKLRGLVKQRLAAVLAAAGSPLSALDVDHDARLESPDGEPAPPELLVAALDNFAGGGGQTGGTDPGLVDIGGGCSWSGEVSGLWAGSGVLGIAHELLHQFGTVDLYGAGGRNSRATTMAGIPGGAPDTRVRLDPWHELQFGVTQPLVGDLTTPGSVTIDHAGGDNGRRAVLLTDPARRFEGFIVQKRLRADPIDIDGPNGWCVWHVAVNGGNHEWLNFASLTRPGGLDASINMLGAPPALPPGVIALEAPRFERGGSRAFGDGTSPELHWWDGVEIGVTLTFSSAPDGLTGTVSWQPLPTSWRFTGPDDLVSTAVGAVPAASGPGLSSDPATGYPIVAVRTTSNQIAANMVFDEQTLSPWGLSPMAGTSESVALTRKDAVVTAAYRSPGGRVLVEYPPWSPTPEDVGADGAEGTPAVVFNGGSLTIAWVSAGRLCIAERAGRASGWQIERIDVGGPDAQPMPGTSPALAVDADPTPSTALAWTGIDGAIRLRWRSPGNSWAQRFVLAGITVPAVLTLDSGYWTHGSPGLALGPDGVPWIAVQMVGHPTSITYGHIPPSLGALTATRTSWSLVRRTIEVGAMTTPFALDTDPGGLRIAWTPKAGAAVRMGVLPTVGA